MLIKTKSPKFFEYILWRVKNHKNFLCCTTGQTGSGKTYTNLKALELLNPNKIPKELIKNVCFTSLEFMDRLNSGELKSGDCLVWDEVGVGLSSKEWFSVSNKLINYVLQTFRHLNLIVLMNTPNFSFIDASSRKLFHCIWETINIDFNSKKCEVKPLLLQTNSRTGKLYYKYLRVNDKQHGLMPVKRIYFSLPSKEIQNLYENKKKAFTTNLNKQIYQELQTMESKRGKNKPLTELQKQVKDMLDSGMNTRQIADKLNVTQRNINAIKGLIRKKGVVLGVQ